MWIAEKCITIFFKLVHDLEVYGFVFNPYDHFVYNMEINWSQITVVWHVNNLKVSHKDSFEVTILAVYLTVTYEGMKVNWGKVKDYLVINLDYSEEIIVKVSIIKYLNNVLHELPEHLGTSASPPAAEHLFKVIPESKTK